MYIYIIYKYIINMYIHSYVLLVRSIQAVTSMYNQQA